MSDFLRILVAEVCHRACMSLDLRDVCCFVCFAECLLFGPVYGFTQTGQDLKVLPATTRT